MSAPLSNVRANEELVAFIAVAKRRGLDDAFVVALLRRNGWSERRVFAAYTSYYAGELAMPIPGKGGQTEAAGFAFLYFINFVTLGFWTTALGQIFYLLISRRFPEPGQPQPYSLRDEIAWQIAAVLVTFPTFAFVHRTIATQLKRRPELYDAGVRQWLTYAALAIAALTVVTDAIWFLTELLKGDLTISFVLKTIVLLALGGGVFGYYLATVRGPRDDERAAS